MGAASFPRAWSRAAALPGILYGVSEMTWQVASREHGDLYGLVFAAARAIRTAAAPV